MSSVLTPQNSVCSEPPLTVCALNSNSVNPTFACTVHGPGSGATMRGHSALFCWLWYPCGVPQWRPPHSAHTSPGITAHTAPAASPNLCRHGVSPTLTSPHPDPLVALACSDRESWQRLGQHGRQHMLHVLLHGPVDVWRRLLGALRSLGLPFEALLALKHTDAAHPMCERPHSPSHRSPSDPLARAPQAPQ